MIPGHLKTTKENNGIRLEAEGDFTLSTLETMKKDLLVSASAESPQTLDVSKCTMMDVVGIQFAYAWKKALSENKKTGTVILPESETIKDLFIKTGITQIL